MINPSMKSREDESGALWRLGALLETAFRGRVGAAGKERPTWLSGFIGLAIGCVTALSCVNYPVETGVDLYEKESVWQYLKTFSIWQDRVPESAFQFPDDSPEMMMYKIYDTLKGISYTHYDDDVCGACMASTGQIVNSLDTMYWTPLTDSTMYLQIQSFSKNSYQHFLSGIIAMHAARDFRKMIIDMRHNGGGDIAATDSIIEAILPEKTPYLIESSRNYDQQSGAVWTVSDSIRVTKGPQHWALKNIRYAVLVDSVSASASEMLTAALKDGFSKASNGDTVVIVGDTTYGKGIGQICISRRYLKRADLKITFMRMKGLKKIGEYHAKGIAPDVACESETPHQQDSIALKILEPSAELPNEWIYRFKSRRLVQYPPEAAIIAPPDDRFVR